ncbi:MAG: DUF502 domain-containing protein [Bacillota bacterium]
MGNLKKYFLAGILTILPVAATIYVLNWLFHIADGFSGDLVALITGNRIRGLGLVVTLLVVLIIGFFTTNVLGRTLISWADKMINRMPVAGVIYRTIKQILEAFGGENKSSFQKVVLIEYPRKGIYALAFVTGVSKGEIETKTDQRLVNLFVPTTPNPTSGFLLLLPEEDLIYLEMPVEDGIKMIISGGVLVPPMPGEKKTELKVARGRKKLAAKLKEVKK